MTNQVTSPVDGVVVIQDPDQRMTWWAMDQVYLGHEGRNKYVPKVHDYVIDRTTPRRPKLYVVVAISVLLVPTFEPVNIWEDTTTATELLGFVGVGPGQINNNVRIYINKDTMPYTCQLDTRMAVPGSMNNYARVYRGSVTAGTQEVISRMYDQSGNLIGDTVPLEPVNDPRYQNNTLRTLVTFKTLADIPDNELLTIVVFADEATTTIIQPAVAMNTAFICTPDLSKRYIKDISLVSPFINPNRPNRLEYPLNTPLNALNLMCRVEYTDGYAMVPVDGSKAYMSGMDGFIATIVGQEIPDLTLHYRLSANEYNYTMRATSGPHISRRCFAVVVDKDDSISVKIFLTFEWHGVNGYRMRFWLYHMTRQRYWEVTDKIRMGDGSMSFNPIGYGIVQRLILTLQLDQVDSLFREYKFVQIVDVVVNQTVHQSPWLVHYEPGQAEASGAGLYCEYRYVSAGYSEVKLNMHCATVDEWLNRLYYNTKPLVDRISEGLPPRPTMFEVQIGSDTVQYRVDEHWNKIMVIGRSLSNYNTMLIRFFIETVDNEIQLGVTSVLMKDSGSLPFYGEFGV